MHVQEVRKIMGVVAPEVRKEFRVFIEPQELADDLDSEDFGVAECGGGSAPSETPAEVLDSVVDQTEDGDDEGAKIHRRRPPLCPVLLVNTERREVFSLVQALRETCTRG